MSRIPAQVLVFPYYFNGISFEYCLFKRKDLKVWQGVAGGVEFGESVEYAAQREVEEEAGIKNGKIFPLETVCSMPSIAISDDFIKKNISIVKEYSFGIKLSNKNIKISNEHLKFKWFNYNEAAKKLFWDSNKTALWELNYKLNNKI